MVSIETKKIEDIYDYVSAGNNYNSLIQADGAFVFCRDDPLVAEKVAELFLGNFVDYIMFTGGIGKDSGYLAELEIPEAKWQAALLQSIHKVSSEQIYIESKATNGGECCRYGIDTIIGNNLSHDNLVVVCHSTSLRRVQATLEAEAKKKGFEAKYHRMGTNYNFNVNNPNDQHEAITELIRLADWPEKGWCTLQEDLPHELVSYAREIKDKF